MRLPDISEMYDADDNALSAHLDWLLEATYLKQKDFILSHAEHEEVHTVTEYGCGSGLLAHALKNVQSQWGYVAVDKSQKLIDIARSKLAYPGEYEALQFILNDLRNVAYPASLVVAFAVLKHISLDEWDDVLGHVLAQGRLACWDMQVLDHDLDNGKDWHHVFVTPARLEEQVKACGHEIVERVVWDEGDVDGHGRCKRVALWTRRT